MIVEQYGLKYTRISHSDLEIVRYWRNQSYIRDTMQFKEYITPKMQENWFKSIDNRHNYYFMIHYQNQKIGLINCKSVSSDSDISEGGIFIWQKDFWNTSIPAYASLSMLQAVFEVFKSGSGSLATISVNNKKALNFNKMLGYEIVGTTPDGEFYKLKLTIENYFVKTKRLIRAAQIASGFESDFKLTAEFSEKQTDEINDYIRKHL